MWTALWLAGPPMAPAPAPTVEPAVSRFAGPAPTADPRPWTRGTGELSVGVGGSYDPQLGLAEFNLGGGYLLLDGLEVGLMGSHAALVWRDGRRRFDVDGERSVPVYAFDLTPFARFLVLRRRWFSPYVSAGVGPTVYGRRGGVTVLGHWAAMPGAWIGLSSRVSLELAVRFSGPIPVSTCEAQVGEANYCSFSWRPRLGVTVNF